MRCLLALICGFFLLYGCGYKPISAYNRETFGERIYVDTKISRRDPENSVLLKDALLAAITERLGTKVATSKEEADSEINVEIARVIFASLSENRDGFTNFYKTYVTLNFTYKDIHGNEGYMTTIGRYTFSIDTSSILTDARRLDAIKQASQQALDVFVSRVAILEYRQQNQQKDISWQP
ncbi:hypothetical protein CCZ01_04565 [Helicobacter monodelphidis]|uniref:LPS assembly lipoprotein LptE n=1 Tax=Helicobacter sp. 15-1451 TaxID=2004995 RepID=UPI000DCE163C|nr:LPS assembly lipoprotein LptE [Helicobacter sp. 15-1451]RAX57907.1 hypothetical protein CCZ01_04565 [Helicobacter sp. 15-1451]